MKNAKKLLATLLAGSMAVGCLVGETITRKSLQLVQKVL